MSTSGKIQSNSATAGPALGKQMICKCCQQTNACVCGPDCKCTVCDCCPLQRSSAKNCCVGEDCKCFATAGPTLACECESDCKCTVCDCCPLQRSRVKNCCDGCKCCEKSV